MGCDGGTIPKRDELVRKKKKPEQKDKDSELSFRWKHCSITQQPLQTPIVACGLGRLYSKDAVIEALLDRTNLPATAQHIKNLKDIKDLQLTPNPSFKQSIEKDDAYVDRQSAQYICPVIGLEMNGKFRFVFLWGCGCVMSERALKEVKTNFCHKCQQPFAEEDIVILNGSPEDVDLMKTKSEARQARLKAARKARNGLKRKEETNSTFTSASSSSGSGDGNASVTSASSSSSSGDGKASVTSASSSSSEGGKASDSSSKNECVNTNGVEEGPESKIQEEKMEKKIVLKTNIKMSGIKDNGSTKRPSGNDIEDPVFKKTKGSYSVAKDPRASDVFKSLFTSHQKAQKQDKAHWITYNPFYN